MTRKLHDIVIEAKDIMTMTHEEFLHDGRYGEQNADMDMIIATATMAQHILLNERIDEAKQSYYQSRNHPIPPSNKGPSGANAPSPGSSPQPQDDIVTVRLSDGKYKTKDVDTKARLKELHFWWNTPKGTYDWNKRMKRSDWDALKTQEPFCGLTAKVE